MVTTQEELITHLRRTTTPITEADPVARVLRASASRTAVETALDLAAGARHEIGWCICGDTAFLAIGHDPDALPLTFAFRSPAHDAFLVAIAEAGAFTLQVEGMIPVHLPVRYYDDALRPYLRQQGWEL